MTDNAKRRERNEANGASQTGQTKQARKAGKKAEEVRAARESHESHESDDELTIAAPTERDQVADTLETAGQPTTETERARPRRAARKPAAPVTPAPSAEQEAAAVEAVETFEAVEAVKTVEEAPLITGIETDMSELEAQGFTADEALRLIDISRRLETSAEARESQAELKRLRFTQWLIERGILDEFSA